MRINVKLLSSFAGLSAAILVVSACSQWQVTDPTSPYFLPLPGSKVIVHQRLEVPPGRTRVFFQHGKLIPHRNIFQYDINCELEINKLADTVRYIEPGTYTVTRTRRQFESIIQNDTIDKPILLAALDTQFTATRASVDGGEGSTMQFEIIRLRLQGEEDSLLRELACRGALADPVNMQMPTIAEMRQALGEYVSIETPQEQNR
ncbi:MAG: hypothetical protein AMJ53_14160 [Gammaproteobacteria bacterium SG8_11]|nr:MAG: hypothetical protein AMJ53_14160 [Gammaproteobacteria bacterium SG8_11]